MLGFPPSTEFNKSFDLLYSIGTTSSFSQLYSSQLRHIAVLPTTYCVDSAM